MRCIILILIVLTSYVVVAQDISFIQEQIASGEYTKAREACEVLLAKESNNAELHCLMGDIHKLLKDPQEAIASYGRAIELKKGYAEAYAKRGFTYYMIADLKHAWLDLIDAAYYEPTGINYFNLGKVEQVMGKTSEALKSYNLALKHDSSLTGVYRQRSEIYLFRQKYPQCLRDIDSALKETPFDAGLFVRRGTVLIAMKKNREAVNMFSRAIRLGSATAAAYYGRGRARFEMQDYRNAIHDFDTAITHDGTMMLAHFCRAMSKLEISEKNREEACVDLKRAASLGYTEALAYIRKYCE